MKAAIYHGRGDIRIEDVDRTADLAQNEIRVKVQAAGICGSDLHEFAEGPITVPDKTPHPITGETLPVRFGHEFGGKVIETGAAVTAIDKGEYVSINPILSCGECRYCREGNYHLCESIGFVGITGSGGGFAEEVVVSEERAVPFPAEINTEYTAIIEPYSVALHAIENGSISPGDTIAVFGAGPIGLATVQIADAVGAGQIVSIEPNETRRGVASEIGADIVIDPMETTVESRLRELSDGVVDVVFEAAGVEQSFKDSIKAVKRGGSVVLISLFDHEISFNPIELTDKEKRIQGTVGFKAGPRSREDFGTVIEMIAEGKFDPEPLITSRVTLDRLVEDGFEGLLAPETEEIKILVTPN